MARTNRKDIPPAPAPSVDALDDLNLDDMFEGGDDSLFDGLDIDLDGMGELSGALDDRKEDKSMSEHLDAMKFNLLGPNEAEETSSSSKRRKTKRKTKTPPPLEEERDEDISPSKKKRRSTKSTNKKSRSKSKQKDEPPSPASSTSSKSKSRTKTSSTMPPPMPRGSSGGQGMVAAAGQFGGRTQKRGSYGLSQKSKTRATTSRSQGPATPPASKARGTAAARSAAGRGSITKQRQELPKDASQESTFCGLLPSSTLFFPFMPSLPPEPSLPKKCHRLYPCLDTINSALSSQATSNDVKPLSSSTTENDTLFKLMFPENDQQQSGASDANATQMLQRATLASAISSARKTVSQMDRAKLINDLRSVCALLKRQHDFVGQSVGNMERWCRDHFSEEDHADVFGSPATLAAINKKRKALAESFMIQGSQLLGKNLAGYGGAVLRVKIKCNGFKEPKMSAVLVARIPGATPAVPRPPGVLSAGQRADGTKKTAPKKRKTSSASASSFASDQILAAKTAVATSEVEAVVSYVDLKPSQRRQRIAEAVASQAMQLEKKHNEMTQGRQVSLLRQEGELQKVVQNDELLMVNTTTLWEWVKKSSYFADYTEDDVNEVLHGAWQPELKDRDLLDEEVSPNQVIHRIRDGPRNEESETSSKFSTKALFDRLHSLLVDVGSDDDMDDSDDEDENDGTGESQDEASEIPHDAILDLSELSLEERTYVHLRSIGLVDTPFLPSPRPSLIEEDESQSEAGEAIDNEDGREDNELDSILRAMHSDLSQLQRVNNSRTALLQSEARKNLSVLQLSKKRQEEQTQQIAKYNQLMKKQKETKRSARQKTVKKDEDWVQW